MRLKEIAGNFVGPFLKNGALETLNRFREARLPWESNDSAGEL